MSSDIDIRVRDLSKVYRIYEKPEDRLVQMATLGRVRRFTEFPALTGISFDIRRGETVGIVGRNGCGKSTLLQIICGTLQPSAGSVEVTGRISALLELGAGFNGEFTGRENVYMNGAILGFSRAEMDERFAAIADFAGIGDFIERPVKTYSSGMFVRLAFAVATAVEPDILVVDEALSVGDEAFQRKCFARIEAIKERGGTILFVSHSAQTIVQLCDRAILLDGGEKLMEGPPKQVVGQYQRLINLTEAAAAQARRDIQTGGCAPPESPAPADETAGPETDSPLEWFDPDLVTQSKVDYAPCGAVIRDVRVTTLSGRRINVLRTGHDYLYRFDVDFTDDLVNVAFGMLIKTPSGLELGGASTIHSRQTVPVVRRGDTAAIQYRFTCSLMPHTYFANAGVSVGRDDGRRYAHRIIDATCFRVVQDEQAFANGLVSFNPRPEIMLHQAE